MLRAFHFLLFGVVSNTKSLAQYRTALVLVAAGLLLVCGNLFSQQVTGSVAGTVVDASGSAIAAASLKVVSETTGAERTATSASTGDFAFNALPPGSYTLAVEHVGFKRYEKKNVALAANDNLSLGEIRMEVGAVSESVTVVAQGTSVQTATGERSGIITSVEVQHLTVINRDFAALLALQPGVVPTPGAESLGLDGDTLLNVQGGRATGNNITLDGMPTDSGISDQRVTFTSMDAVAAVKVLSSTYQAEFGRKPGAAIQAVTKSGTQSFHGSAYWYKRHEEFNAGNFFNHRNKVPEPPYRYTTAGFNIGGPVYIPGKFNRDRGKLFFFFSTEELRESRPQPIRQVTMPTAQERLGDFSDSRDVNGALIVVRDPLTKQQFPSNIVPASRIDKNGQNYLNLLPLPNFFDTNVSGRRYNYQIQESVRIPKRIETLRIDHNLDPKTTIYGRMN